MSNEWGLVVDVEAEKQGYSGKEGCCVHIVNSARLSQYKIVTPECPYLVPRHTTLAMCMLRARLGLALVRSLFQVG
jgi:hypothetical protein